MHAADGIVTLYERVSSGIVLNIACCVIQSVVNKSDRLFGVRFGSKLFC
jgi:hypothetical protein